jgi:zinc transport system substrate-binding protein
MQKKIFVAVVALLVASGVYAFLLREPVQKKSGEKISVVTTLFPLYDFARAVGGDQVDVTLLLPPGVEAHAFEPKPSDIVKIDQADIFVYTGKMMEPWAEDIAASAAAKGVRIVDASRGIELIPGVFHDEDEPAGSMDPHIWLDFDNATKMAVSIAEALAMKDSAHAAEYKANAAAYSDRLGALDSRYRETLASCKTKTIVYGGHYALGYLAHRYGLEYTAAQGIAPDAEPTAQDLAAMVEQIRREHVDTVFYEELSSPKIAETIASETGAKLLLLNAAHNIAKEDYTKGVTFTALMEENLAHLREGLKCSQE